MKSLQQDAPPVSLGSPDEPMPEYIPGRWFIDPTHSQVTFTVRHSMVHLRCAFTDVKGVIVAGDRLEDSQVVATIDPLSFSSGLAIRDTKVRSLPAFLWADMYPSIEFASTGLEVDHEAERAVLIGDLTLLGATREVRLALTTAGIGRTDIYGTRSGFSATTTINARDFGILRGSLEKLRVSRPLSDENEMLGWTMEVHVEIEAVLEADAGRYGIDKSYATAAFAI